MYSHAGMITKFGMLMGVVPLALGVVYAIAPTERRLMLMRPLSLTALFAALCGTVAGLVNVFRWWATNGPGPAGGPNMALLGLSESLVPLVTTFGCLTVAWLAVALGMRRQQS